MILFFAATFLPPSAAKPNPPGQTSRSGGFFFEVYFFVPLSAPLTTPNF